MTIKGEITASMCTNKIRALAVAAVDKVNGTVVPKGSKKNKKKHWMAVGSCNSQSMLFSRCVYPRD